MYINMLLTVVTQWHNKYFFVTLLPDVVCSCTVLLYSVATSHNCSLCYRDRIQHIATLFLTLFVKWYWVVFGRKSGLYFPRTHPNAICRRCWTSVNVYVFSDAENELFQMSAKLVCVRKSLTACFDFLAFSVPQVHRQWPDSAQGWLHLSPLQKLLSDVEWSWSQPGWSCIATICCVASEWGNTV